MKFWIALFCTSIGLLCYGYSYSGEANISQYLPYIISLQNAHGGLFGADRFLESFSSFPSIYPNLMAWLSGFANLETLHLILYLILRFFATFLVYEIANEIFKDKTVSAVSCLLFAISPVTNSFCLMGEDPIMKTALYHTSFAGPFALLSVLLFLREKYAPSMIIAGGLFFINGLVGIFLTGIYCVYSYDKLKHKKLAFGWLSFGVIFCFWLAWYSHLARPFGSSGYDITDILRIWYPGHYFPFLWSKEKWIKILVYFGFFSISYFRCKRNSSRQEKTSRFMYAFVSMWALAFVSSEILNIGFITKLQLFRSDSIFSIFLIVFCAKYVSALYKSETLQNCIIATLMILALSEVSPPYYALNVFVLVAIHRFYKNYFVQVVAIVSLVIILSNIAKYPQMHFKNATFVLLTVFLVFLSENLSKIKIPKKFVWIFPLAALLPFLPIFAYRINKKTLEFEYPFHEQWIALQKWTKENTDAKDVFITPPQMGGFRAFSERSTVLEWLDGAAIHWSSGFDRVWISKIDDYLLAAQADIDFFSLHGPQDIGYERITSSGFLFLSKKYKAKYLVTFSKCDLDFPRLFENDFFKVYLLKG
jgi:Domain of unknown function (DUF6798)